jgi:methyl-accepting chemotaxis protein
MEQPRRRILVDRKFQLQYLTIWLWVGVLMVVLSSLFYLLFAREVLGVREQDPVISKLMGGVSGFLVLFCLLMGILGVFLSHRVAGAAYRLDMMLRRLIEGDLEQRIVLRSGDYLQNLAGGLTELQDTLKRSETAIAEIVGKLDEFKLGLAREGKIGEAEKATFDEIVHPLRLSFARRGEKP